MSANEPLAVGDRVRRLRSRLLAGTVVRIVRDDPQLVEVSWDGAAPPFNLVTMPASNLKRLEDTSVPHKMTARRFAVGDRVRRLRKPGTPGGTVVGIFEDEPQIVEVSWDSSAAGEVMRESSQHLVPIAQERRRGA